MAVPVEKKCYSIAEYLALEEKSETKNEFHDGEILAMAGGTYEASRIVSNVIIAGGSRLRGGRCHMLESNMRVRIGHGLYVYPDASILCGPPMFDPDDRKRTTITNPNVVIEVLSESTETYDRGEKFSSYRQLESLQEYVLISQIQPMVETFFRQADGAWRIETYRGMEAVARLRCVEIDLPLAEVYAGVKFGEEAKES